MADSITVSREGGQITGGDNDWRTLYVAAWNETLIVDGISDSLDLGGPTLMEGALTVTALTGSSPTLDLIVQTSVDDTTWVTAKAYTQATGATAETPLPYPVHRYIRINRNYGGTVATSSVSFSGTFIK
jgi:hypothetical protein